MTRLLAAALCLFASTAEAATYKPVRPAHQTPIVRTNMNCGLPPLPPIGCRIGPCQCDASGRFCQWTFICR